MRNLKIFVAVLLLSICFSRTWAQDFQNPGDYMNYITGANDKITAIYLSYLSAVAHNKSARKVEKRRTETVNSIFETRFSIQGMPPWKGDRTYRDSTVSYLKLLYNVFNEDYAKIVNMEEIAEQSYDGMEAYMLAQAKAREKLQDAAKRQNVLEKEFGNKYNVNVIEAQDQLSQKSKQADELMSHYDKVYLVFFKPYKQEAYLMNAINKKDINAIEQNKNSIQKFAEEGLDKLHAMDGYNNDPTLIAACRDAMNFYKDETLKAQLYTDFYLKEETFNKLKKNFDSKPASQRTQQDIDLFNNGVKEFNAAVSDFNKSNNQLNKQRTAMYDAWNKAVDDYLDRYMPVQRKQ